MNQGLVKILLSTSILIASVVFASDYSGLIENQKFQNKVLREFVQKMKAYEEVSMKVEKRSIQSLLGRETKNSGEMAITRDGKFWWKVTEPQKTLLVFDGEFAWNEERLPEDFGGGVKVAKSKHFKQSPAYKILNVLMGNGDLSNYFSPLKATEKEGIVSIELTPLKSNWNISILNIVIEKNKSKLQRISYVDDLENETVLSFSGHKQLEAAEKKKFIYQPPTGAEVTEL